MRIPISPPKNNNLTARSDSRYDYKPITLRTFPLLILLMVTGAFIGLLQYALFRLPHNEGHGESQIKAAFNEAACKLQRDWLATNPEDLPFAKHVKENTLLELVQKGLEWFDIESRLPPVCVCATTWCRGWAGPQSR